MKTGIITLMILLFSCTACIVVVNAEKIKGNGKLVTKHVQISDFDKIEIGQGINSGSKMLMKKGVETSPVFNYTQQKGSSSLRITIDENLYPLLKFKTSDQTLSISVANNDQVEPTKLVISASSENLKRVGVSGCIDFNLLSALSGDNLELYVSGASDLNMSQSARLNNCKIMVSGAGNVVVDDLNCTNIDCKVSGAGDIDLKGNAVDGVFKVSGSGDIKAYGFEVKRLDCAVSGSGDVKVYVTEKLDARASGSGDIQYKGNPSAKTRVSGSGDINRVN